MILKIKRRMLEQGTILTILAAFAIVALIGVSFTTSYVLGATNITNNTVIAKVNITNTDPNITSLTVNDGVGSASEIDLTANSATIVMCNATVFDYNGIDDILRANATNATFYIESVGSDVALDNNSLYRNTSCGRCRNATETEAGSNPFETTVICDCRIAVQYYANASNSWACLFGVRDTGGTQKSGSELNLTATQTRAAVTITKLLAIDAPAILDYGNLSVTQTSPEIVHNVTNVGNIPFNLSLRGFGGTNDSVNEGTTNATMICEFGNISIGNQRYSTVNGTAFGSMRVLENRTVKLTNMTDPDVNITWPHRTDDSHVGKSRNSTFWRIQVPLSVGGICNGTIVFGAIDAS